VDGDKEEKNSECIEGQDGDGDHTRLLT